MMSERDIEIMLFGSRRCTACGHPFPASSEYFHVDKSRVDGLTSHCKACLCAAGRAAYGRDPGKYVETNRRYRQRKAARP